MINQDVSFAKGVTRCASHLAADLRSVQSHNSGRSVELLHRKHILSTHCLQVYTRMQTILAYEKRAKFQGLASPQKRFTRCFGFSKNQNKHLWQHFSTRDHAGAMAQMKPLSEKLQEIMETCNTLEIEGLVGQLSNYIS